MTITLHAATYLVRDYDEAIDWFRLVLGFEVVEDRVLSATKRWVRVAAPDGRTCLLLAKAEGAAQLQAISQAAGGRVAYFAHTDDFAGDHARMMRLGVRFTEEPRHESYGTVCVFADLYGNLWDLIEPSI